MYTADGEVCGNVLTKISEQVHEVNKTLLWKDSPGSTHRMGETEKPESLD